MNFWGFVEMEYSNYLIIHQTCVEVVHILCVTIIPYISSCPIIKYY
jgi:hypothetical protein